MSPESELRIIAKAGHYSTWEQPEVAHRLLRQFLDGLFDFFVIFAPRAKAEKNPPSAKPAMESFLVAWIRIVAP